MDLQKNQEDIDTSVKTYNIMSSLGKTQTGKLTLVTSSAFQFITPGTEPRILHEDWDSGSHQQKFKLQLKQGQQYQFALITCLMSSEHHEDPGNEAIRMVIRASSMTNILTGHIKRWAELW